MIELKRTFSISFQVSSNLFRSISRALRSSISARWRSITSSYFLPGDLIWDYNLSEVIESERSGLSTVNLQRQKFLEEGLCLLFVEAWFWNRLILWLQVQRIFLHKPKNFLIWKFHRKFIWYGSYHMALMKIIDFVELLK